MPGRNTTIVLGAVLASCVFACGEKAVAPPSCTYTVTSSALAFTATGGTGSASVATAASCSWNAAADAPWITLSSGTGNGSAAVQFAVSSNAATSSRKATLTIAGQPLAISQEGRAACDYAVAPSSVDLAAVGGSASIAVSAANGCEWTAVSPDSWVTFSSSPSGSGNGAVAIVVSANAVTSDRTTTLTVAGRSVSVRQSAAPATPPKPANCEYTISPTEMTQHWHGTGFSVTVATAPGCAWTASPSETWLSVDRTSGDGAGTITVSHGQFTDDATRRAAVQLRWPTQTAGQNLWVTQEGCRYGLEPTTTVAAAGGTRMVIVVTQAVSSSCSIGCPWTAVSNAAWIRVTSSMPRAGDDAFTYQVDANAGTARVGTITVAGKTHTVTQAGS